MAQICLAAYRHKTPFGERKEFGISLKMNFQTQPFVASVPYIVAQICPRSNRHKTLFDVRKKWS